MHHLYDTLPVPYVRVTSGALDALLHRIIAEPRSTAGFLFLALCTSEMILLAPYSMLRDWRVSRAGPMLFIGLSCYISLP